MMLFLCVKVDMSAKTVDFESAELIEKFQKNHMMKRTLQIKGWGKNIHVFNKLKFYNEWYLTNKNLLDSNHVDDTLLKAIKSYIEPRNPASLFTTKFLDIKTEKNLPYDLDTNDIENNFEKLLSNEENNKLKKFPKILEENLDYMGQYFSLQKSRTFQQLSDLLVYYKSDNKFEKNREYALRFREHYNKQYLKMFYGFHKNYVKNRNNLLFINGNNDNEESFYYLPEINTMSFYDYLRFVPFKHDYNEDLLKKSYFTILKNNKMVFYVVKPSKWTKWDRLKIMIKKRDYCAYFLDNPHETDYYSSLAEHLASTWNSFALNSCCEYCIIKNEEFDINYIKDCILLIHANGGMDKFYNEDCSNTLEIKELEKLL